MTKKRKGSKINSGGGAVIRGSVHADGDFVGRDQYKYVTILPSDQAVSGRPQIPQPPADFVGREAEIAALCQSVKKGAIITGLGGIGKTALAYKAAERMQPNYPDGGIYLDLHGPEASPLTPEQAIEQIIRVFYPTAKLPENMANLQVLYTKALGDKRLLLLLDNARDQAQVAPLLDALPSGCLSLVTSRMHFYYPGMQEQHLDVLPESEAIQLLQTIAPRIGEQAAELAGVCGYLPLALHVIGSLLHKKINLCPEDVLVFMQDAVTRLEMTTMDASLELSYRMLPKHLREPWRKLAVFAGDFEEWAVAWVWKFITNETRQEEDKQRLHEVKQMLGELITYSLLEYKDSRYRLHDLARLFAAGKMSIDEDDDSQLIHAIYYFNVLLNCNKLYEQGNEKVLASLSLFDRERREIASGREWATACLQANIVGLPVDVNDRLKLCCYYPYVGNHLLGLRLHPLEQILWLEQGLSAMRRLNSRLVEGTYFVSLGNAYDDMGEVKKAIEYYKQWLTITRENKDRSGEEGALGSLGSAYYSLGEMRQAKEFHEQALKIAREIGDLHGEGNALGNIGLVFADLGELQLAIESFEQQLRITHEIGDLLKEGNALNGLGVIYTLQGEYRRAIEYIEQSLVIKQQIGNQHGEGNALASLGNAYAALGEINKATKYYEQSLTIAREIGDRRGEANACWNLGRTYEKMGDLPRAAELMQVRVDYLRGLGHLDAEKLSVKVDNIRARMAEQQENGLIKFLKFLFPRMK